MQRFSKIGILIALSTIVTLSGVLIVESNPTSAQIIINGKVSQRITPDTLELDQDMATITVALPGYSFEKRTVLTTEGDTLRLSFTQIIVDDTISIIGNTQYGILNITQPPLPIPYLIDDHIQQEYSKVLLAPGIHHINWDGGISYVPIDTTMDIKLGAIHNLELQFNQRYGAIKLSTQPDSALIYINNTPMGVGQLVRPLEAGQHTLIIESRGYNSDTSTITVLPQKTYSAQITIHPSGDQDGDGFPDSTDLCPEEYGVYSGCPSIDRRNEIRKVSSFLGKHFIYQPFTVHLGILSYARRTAYNKDARDNFNLYNDGAPLFNNYRGFQALNKVWVGASFFIASAEYGQSFNGLNYQKSNYIIDVNGGDSLFLAYYEYDSQKPKVKIKSGSFQAGVRFSFKRVGFALLTGYHIETITYKNLVTIDKTTNVHTYVDVTQKNNLWITTLQANIAFTDEPYFPRLYLEADFTSKGDGVTGWSIMEIGFLIPFYKMK